jgi:hypothetical protein
VATKVNGVEEDKIVTICEENTVTNEVEEVEVEVIDTPVKCVEVNPSFWDKIVTFFRNLFS